METTLALVGVRGPFKTSADVDPVKTGGPNGPKLRLRVDFFAATDLTEAV
jgi:hypothetical protein